MASRLSAIICTHDRYKTLPDAIATLLAQNRAPDEFAIIVIDNSPDQAQAAAFARQYAGIPHLTYILEPRPGLSNARNLGAARATTPFIAYIDDDALARPGWAAAILAAFTPAAASPAAQPPGAVGGKIQPRWQAPIPAWLGGDAARYLSLLDHGPHGRALAPNEMINGCNMGFDRALLLGLGGFSTQLGRIGGATTLLSNEELELTRRIRAAGRLIAYTPHAIVEHQIDPSRLTQTWFRRRAAWQSVSDYLANPNAAQDQTFAAARHLRMLAKAGPPACPAGTFIPATTPGAFSAELLRIRHMTTMILAGGIETAMPPPIPNVATRLAARLSLWLITHLKPRLKRLRAGQIGIPR